MITGVSADDITGANDIGVMFSKAGCPAAVFTWDKSGGLDNELMNSLPEGAVILNTNSRLDTRQEAYQKVYKATLALKAAGCKRYFKKTCSVFRGNIGAEFDAMLDALGLNFAVVVLGFPANGRFTLDGRHYVHGLLLEESEFRHDPIHPMVNSDLVQILSVQTRRRVALINHDTIALGWRALRWCIAEMKTRCNYLILDVASQDALRTIAEAVHDEPVLCGSSALAQELPRVWGLDEAGEEDLSDQPLQITGLAVPESRGSGLLVACGSLMPQTKAQVEYLKQRGIVSFELDGQVLFGQDEGKSEIERLVKQISAELRQGRDVLFHTEQATEAVQHTQAAGKEAGFSQIEVSRSVATALAEVCAKAMADTGQDRLVVAGGETSAAVCNRLGVKGMQIWKEIQPGVPACYSIPSKEAPHRLLLVLKSGSFGDEKFLEEALKVVKAN